MRKFTGALSALVLFGLSACGPDQNDSLSAAADRDDAAAAALAAGAVGPVTGEVKEWSVTLNRKSSDSGEVTFWIANKGTTEHEFLVVRTDYPNGQIPLDGDHFSEDAEGLTVVDEISEWEVGQIKELTVELTPGNYQLLCNIPNHYANGMHTEFTVTP